MSRAFRPLLLLLLLVNGAMTTVLVWRAPGVLDRIDGVVLLTEALAATSIAAAAAAWLLGRSTARPTEAALVAGILAGTLLAVHLVSENVGARVGENSGATLAFMAATFLCWAAAGAFARPAVRDAATAGFGASVLSVSLTVACGYLLAAFGMPPADYVASWPEYQRSGWTNPAAFSVANTFDAAVGHVLVAIVLGPVLGALGLACASVLGRLRKRYFSEYSV